MNEPEVNPATVKVDKDGNVIGDLYIEETPATSEKESERKHTNGEKIIKPLVNKQAVKKKSRVKKLKEALFGEDVENVPEYVLYDILIPAFKKLLADMINGAVGMALFGDGSPRRGNNPNRTHVSMSSIYEGRSEGRYGGQRMRKRNKASDIVFDDRDSANYVLDQMMDLIDQYGSCSLQDLYSLIGVDSAHTDGNWGWTNLRGAAVIAVSDGYILDLPPIKALV